MSGFCPAKFPCFFQFSQRREMQGTNPNSKQSTSLLAGSVPERSVNFLVKGEGGTYMVLLSPHHSPKQGLYLGTHTEKRKESQA